MFVESVLGPFHPLSQFPERSPITAQKHGVERTEEIREELTTLKPSLSEEYGVVEIGFFGSYVRGEQHEESDLDIRVKFADPIGLFDLVRLEQELSEHLAVDVDLVTERSVKPRIRSRVIDEVEYV